MESDKEYKRILTRSKFYRLLLRVILFAGGAFMLFIVGYIIRQLSSVQSPAPT